MTADLTPLQPARPSLAPDPTTAFDLTRRAGRMTLSAEDLIGMAISGTHFDAVATYAPPEYGELKTGAGAAEVLKATAASL